jgi:hypothetical protein
MSDELQKKYEISICPRCGNQFTCTLGINCWCFEKVISEKVRMYIRENYSDCLCEACLDELKETKYLSEEDEK